MTANQEIKEPVEASTQEERSVSGIASKGLNGEDKKNRNRS